MPRAPQVSGPGVPLHEEPPRDAAVARLAAAQHGVVSLSQLQSLGLSASGVRKQAGRGRLHRVHRGVYAVGHPLLGVRGRWNAAVLACGPRAVLSHRSAADLWELRASARPRPDVSVPRRSAYPRPAIDLHACTSLLPADVTSRHGIPCTTLARTLLDLADVVDRRGIERALEQAEVLRLLDVRAVERVLARAGGRAGAGVLRAVLADLHEPALTASELEERFLALCRGAGIAAPEPNAWLVLAGGAFKVDFLWRAERLVVETDGHAFHGSRQAFERDRRRDQLLQLAGYRVMRATWRQLAAEPGRLAATVGALLAAPRGR